MGADIFNSRSARREAEARRKAYTNDYVMRLTALLHNAISFENIGDLPKRYLMRTLIRFGQIAYDKETKLYLRCSPIGIDVYGLPDGYMLYGYNGTTLQRTADDVVILRLNDLSNPLLPYLKQQAEKLTNYDMAIEQNLEAIKTMTLIECYDKETLLSLVNLENSRRLGSSVAFVNKVAMPETKTNVMTTGAQYLVDKLKIDRQKELNETLAYIGINSANTEKKERVQGLEVEASNEYAESCIDTLIDTFNYDAKFGNLNIKAIRNKENKDTNNDGGEQDE